VAFIMGEYLAGVIRVDPVTAYRDAVSVGYILGKAQSIGEYFHELRWNATYKGLRGPTLVFPPAHAPTNETLEALSEQFRKEQMQRAQEG
jgi:hypothetical protein